MLTWARALLPLGGVRWLVSLFLFFAVTPSLLAAPLYVDAEAERRALERVNRERVAAHLPPLRSDERLRSLARYHSADMALAGFLSAASPRYGSLAERAAEACGIEDSSRVRTHVGIGTDLFAAGAVPVEASLTRIGIGVVSIGGRLFVTQVAVADPRPLPPPSSEPPGTRKTVSAEVRALLRSLRRGRDTAVAIGLSVFEMARRH